MNKFFSLIVLLLCFGNILGLAQTIKEKPAPTGLALEVTFLKEERTILMGLGEVLLIGIFFFVNFRFLKFSFGEKVAGIQKKYIKQ